jgi:transcriptional regulator of acetoin/glycerol metabolism
MTRGSDNANRLSYSLKPTAPKDIRDRAVKEISAALRKHAGNISAAADELDVGRITLHRWVAAHAVLRKAVDSARVGGPV